jgi:hypothetical protein
MPVAFLLSLLGAAFTSWSAWGNAIDLCFTAGCTIYQDATIAGISVWWIGAGGFGLLALLAIVGRPMLALCVAAIALFLDCFLLLLLAVTSPCVACLIAGMFFALVYAAFRSAALVKRPLSRSWLLLFWSFLLIANLLNVARSEMGTWAIKQAAAPNMKFYFSPACSACQEGLRSLAEKTDVSFYAVAKNDQEILLIAAMRQAVRQGANMAEALKRAQEEPASAAANLYTPDMLLLRFALLRNASYALNAGGGVLPLIEYLGLPQENAFHAPRPERKSPPPPPRAPDAVAPVENEAPAQCGGSTPCP